MTGSLATSQRGRIEPFHVMEVMRAAEERSSAGGEVLHLEVGQPSTAAPEGVRAAAHKALDDDALGYTVALGIAPLRQRIAQHYGDWYDLDLDPARVVVTAGASAGCVLAFLAAFDAGARVGVVTPGYPCYRNMLRAFGVEPVSITVDAADRYQPTVAHLAATAPLDGVVLASPSNPTGTMLDATDLHAVLGHCREAGVRVVSDEIYHGITYGQSAPTAATDPDAIVVNSFSKYFSMTGWRLGWLVLPADLVPAVEALTQNLYISASTLSQLAAVAAFDCHGELEANVERYAANRSILLDGLRAAGFHDLVPADGAFYVYAGVGHLGRPSPELCTQWLDELGVAATPGIDFDPERGDQTVRFSFAGSGDEIAEAMRRLGGHLRQC